MKRFGFAIMACVALLIAAFGVSAMTAKAATKHAIEVTVTGESGRPVHNAHIYVDEQRPRRTTIDENWSDASGRHTFMVPDIEGKYCIWAVYNGAGGGTSYQHCFENEYPSTVDLVLH